MTGPASDTVTLPRCSFRYERQAMSAGYLRVAGCDEAGRGCLFGPVFAAAAILNPDLPLPGVTDSKQLPADRREQLAEQIRKAAVAWAVASSDVSEIERFNILQASRLAMKRAVEALSVTPDFLLVDAITVDLPIPQRPLIQGDALSKSIAAASILAKVHRDACMREWDRVYPHYGLAKHKGYATAEHLAAIRRFGPTPQHRMCFAPLRQLPLFADQAEAHAAGRR